MPRGSLPNSTSGGLRTSVRVVVIGDRGTGKSSLIAAAATESFPDNVPPVLPPTRLPADYYPDGVPVTIIDTSSSTPNKGKVAEELQRSDAVVLTYACDQRQTPVRLSTFWLLELRRLEVKVPVIIVGCKLDMRDEGYHISLEEVMAPITQRFREIETCIECSAANLVQMDTFKSKNGGYEAVFAVVTYCRNRKEIDGRSKFRILLSFGQHERELITSDLALRILSILSDEQFLPKMVRTFLNNAFEKLVIKVVPMENLNGHKIVEDGDLCER